MQPMKNLYRKRLGKYMYVHHVKKLVILKHHLEILIQCTSLYFFNLYLLKAINFINSLFSFNSFSSFRMRSNQSFLDRVSFRRRTPTRRTQITSLNNSNTNNSSNIRSIPSSTVAAMRSCIDTLSETVSIAPSSIVATQEGSSSGK